MNLLGDSLEKIAFEKAGIIKTGIPIVLGEALPETQTIFEQTAKEKRASLSIASKKRQLIDWKWEKHELLVEVAEEHHTDHKIYHLDLPGIYQTKNLLTLLEACSQLQQLGWHIDYKTIHEGLRQTKRLTGLYGRWEIIHHNPLIILDVGHNEDGIKQIVQQLELTEHEELHIVLGLVKDKEIDKILSLLPHSAHYYFTQANIPRALSADILRQEAKHFNLNGQAYPDVNMALQAAMLLAGEKDLILVCGSVFLIGEVKTLK